jgi:hypothetical protein
VIDRKEVPGVIIVAPDGEVVQAGISYGEENLKETAKHEETEEEVIYRLYESLIPYLYFTNKLSQDLEIEFEQIKKTLSIINNERYHLKKLNLILQIFLIRQRGNS